MVKRTGISLRGESGRFASLTMARALAGRPDL